MEHKRLRDYQLQIGNYPIGTNNAITDVPGVKVGQVTLKQGEGKRIPGKGPIRTGVTVILPHGDNLYYEKVRGASLSLNGHSKVFGLEQLREIGLIETPIALTSTLNVGLVLDAMVEYMFGQVPDLFTVNPVVGETNDAWLNDPYGRYIRKKHVFTAIENASDGPVEEGAVGAGTGTVCFDWKGGIGTSSRVLKEAGGFHVGVLVQSNYGDFDRLVMCGVPVGKMLREPKKHIEKPAGSIMIVLATDAPMTSRQLRRMCQRVGIGLGRTGSIYGHTSGDVVIAFSTANRIPHKPDNIVESMPILIEESNAMKALFSAAADCTEEAILNSLLMAETTTGWDDHKAEQLPAEEAVSLVKKHLNI